MVVKTHIFRLDEPMRSYALDAFKKLADGQRGEPESIGAGAAPLDSPIHYATGVYTWMSEHIGDITHRMSQRHCERIRFGYEFVLEKVNRGLKTLGRDYGFKREMDENLKSSFRDKSQYGKLKEDSWESFLANFQAESERYAEAHAKLVVYNEAQWCAREAAVALGRMNFSRCLNLLVALKRYLDSDWVEHAGTVYVDGDRIVPYEEARTAKRERVANTQASYSLGMVAESDEEQPTMVIRLRGSGEPKADWPSTKFFAEYDELTQDHPMLRRGERIIMFSQDDYAMMTLRPSIDDRAKEVHFEDIRTPRIGSGLGSRALKWLCDLADKHGVTLEGTAKAYRDDDAGTLKNKELVAWYKRHGFKVGRGDAYDGWPIVRKPRS